MLCTNVTNVSDTLYSFARMKIILTKISSSCKDTFCPYEATQ